ncbi:MAG: helix-turn-helix domain-containing protein, partial [Candidatus Hydrogenedentes bacterium]|nr:helix-turn-helix domain-containing protein [Candidatus Hydrogenedentota bacterium]
MPLVGSTQARVGALGTRPLTRGRNAMTELLTVKQVSKLLNCSCRTVWRLADAGRIPRPISLNSLRRWDRSVLDDWIGNGCPATQRTKG